MRRLVICCDGTWNSTEKRGVEPSNVVRLARGVSAVSQDGVTQVLYYDAGVGTDNLFDQITGGAFGVGLGRNVRQAYSFLVNNYAEGDEIYFFGFSRGAFTVRSVAGFVRKLGILRKDQAGRIHGAWDLYRRRDLSADSEDAKEFRKHAIYPVRTRFLGVWDTVGALGIPGLLNFIGRKRFAFHDVALSRSVDFAYHAVAIDEKRRFFQPTLWEQHPEAGDQVMEQAWFPGVHADVGGGYPEKALCSSTLDWMVAKARGAGLAFDEDYLARECTPDALGPLHESRNGPYRLIPSHHRPIGRGVPAAEAAYSPPGPSNESVDASSITRYTEDASYRPPELVRYMETRAGHGEKASQEAPTS